MTSRRKFLKSAGTITGVFLLGNLASGAVLPDVLDVHLSSDGKDYQLDAVEIILKQSHIPGNGALTILADTVIINSAISLPGRSLTVLARHISFLDGGKILTSGAPTAETYTGQVAATGRTSGASGDAGRNGGKGMDGGGVQLYAESFSGNIEILADGANGGDAESGGIGADGNSGKGWSSGMLRGEDGANGGTPGAPGRPGDGGNGGPVSVVVLNGEALDPKVKVTNVGGKGGAVGQPGVPGRGGKAGAGGSYREESGACI